MRSLNRLSLPFYFPFSTFILGFLTNCHRRVENLKDMVLYRFGSTGVVQCLSRAASVLGLVPIFPVRNINTFSSGSGTNAVFRDCVLVKK